jgi:hypothetical protein
MDLRRARRIGHAASHLRYELERVGGMPDDLVTPVPAVPLRDREQVGDRRQPRLGGIADGRQGWSCPKCSLPGWRPKESAPPPPGAGAAAGAAGAPSGG